jgi:hypothetical protein
MTDINHLTKSRRPACQYDEGVYDMEQQQRLRSSSTVRTNTRVPRPTMTTQDVMDDVYDQPRRASTIASRTQNGGTRMRQRPDTDEPDYRQYRSTTEPHPTRRSSATQAQPTQAQKVLRPKTYMQEPERQQQRYRSTGHRFHPMTWLGGGMCAMLVLIFATVNILCWHANGDQAASYTQTAHRDELMMTTPNGQQEKIKAFIDDQGHLSALVIPADATKARTIGGPIVLDNPQNAMLSATVKDGQVEIDAVYPYTVSFWSVEPSEAGARWKTDIQVRSVNDQSSQK